MCAAISDPNAAPRVPGDVDEAVGESHAPLRYGAASESVKV